VIKKINIKNMKEEEKRNTYREAKILELLNHPGIIHFREIYKNSIGELCIVMDYADGKILLVNNYRWGLEQVN
jgi:NIMA (never in mitosis gene a)-related kinase